MKSKTKSIKADINLKQYIRSVISKVFPKHSSDPFRGVIKKVDRNWTDDLPLFVEYDDGDAEWISWEEFKQLVVELPDGAEPVNTKVTKKAAAKAPEKAAKPAADSKGKGKAAAPAAAPSPAKRGRPTKAAPAAASPAKTATRSIAAAPAAASPRRQPAAAAQPSPAAFAGSKRPALTISESATPSKRRAGTKDGAVGNKEVAVSPPAAAAAGPSAAQKPADLPKPASRGAKNRSDATAATNEVLEQVHKAAAAAKTTKESSDEESMEGEKGVVVTNKMCYLTVMPVPPALGPGASLEANYQAQIKQAFVDIDRLLAKSGGDKNKLLMLDVLLRDAATGLPIFKAAWDAWMGPSSTIVFGGVPASAILHNPESLIWLRLVLEK